MQNTVLAGNTQVLRLPPGKGENAAKPFRLLRDPAEKVQKQSVLLGGQRADRLTLLLNVPFHVDPSRTLYAPWERNMYPHEKSCGVFSSVADRS